MPPPAPWQPVPPRRSTGLLAVWMILYGAVGAQMGWILRPFIGHPEVPFAYFRDRDSNFFEAVLRTLGQLFGL